MRAWAGLWVGAALACEPASSRCGDGEPEVGVFCFPARDTVRLGHGFAPEAMLVADLDGDELPDLAAVNPGRQTLSITWGGPGGGFTRLTSWPLAEEVAGLAHGDLDGDGDLDLATTLPASDAVAVLYNHGARGFALRRHATGAAPQAVIAVDLEPGGATELITANFGEGSVRVLREGVADPPTFVGPGPRGLAAGDLDGDGSLDVAVALAEDDAVQVLQNAGGLLLPAARHTVGVAPEALVIGDLDADGAADLAVANVLGHSVSVILGDGHGGARESRIWPVMPQPTGLTLLRGGGVPPVLGVMSVQTSELLSLDPRTGEVAPGAIQFAGAISAADLDRDGREELLCGEHTGSLTGLRPGPGLRFTSLWQALSVPAHAPIDVDGDGVDEFLVREPHGLRLWSGPEDSHAAEPPLKLGDVRGYVAGDLNGDGREELVVWQASPDGESTTFHVVTWQPAVGLVVGPGPVSLPGQDYIDAPIFGDVGGDGTTDLVFVTNDYGANRTGSLWRIASDGIGGLSAPEEMLPRGSPREIAVADLDGDPSLDLIVHEEDGGRVLLYANLAAGSVPLEAPKQPWVGRMLAGDLDGDGREDLMFSARSGLRVMLDIAGPEPVTAAVATAVADEPCSPMALRDLDGDGDLDVVLQCPTYATGLATSLVTRISLLANDGAAGFQPAGQHIFNGNPALVERGVAGLGVLSSGPAGAELWAIEPGRVLLPRPIAELGTRMSGSIVDLDGDGRADWFAAFKLEMAAAFGQDGGFGPTHHVASAEVLAADVTRVQLLVLADLDGDGADEAVVLSTGEGRELPLQALTVVRVDAAGGFTSEPILRVTTGVENVYARDLDGDGHVDLLLLLVGGGRVAATRLRGRGDGSFEPPRTQLLELPNGSSLTQLAEIDGDDRLDLVVHAPRGVMFASGQPGGDFDPLQLWGGPGEFGLRLHGLFADLTGDGHTDMLYPGPPGLLLYPGDGRQAVGAPRLVLRAPAYSMAVHDFDGDGRLELLVVSWNYHNGVLLQRGRNTGEGGFVFTSRSVPSADGVSYLAVRDFDGDARPDVALLDTESVTILRQRP